VLSVGTEFVHVNQGVLVMKQLRLHMYLDFVHFCRFLIKN
jgi:hypothetical protein